MAGNVVSNVKKYYGGQVPVPGQGDSDGKVKVLVEKTTTMEIGGVQTDVDLLYDADDLTTPVTPQKLGQWTDENYLIVFKTKDADGKVRGFILYALETTSTSTDTLVNNATFVAFKGLETDPGASAFMFTMVEDSSTLTRYLQDENGELTVRFNLSCVDEGAQSGPLSELIGTNSSYMQFEIVYEDDNAYLDLNTEWLDEEFEGIRERLGTIEGILEELPSDEHGYFNSSLVTTPGDGTTTSILIDNFRISAGRDVHGDNIEFVPTHQEGGVDFGEVYLNPGTYILNVHYTLQWVGRPRGTFLPLVTNVGEQPFDFSYEHEDILRSTRIVTKTTRGKFGLNFPFDADTPQMGIWVKYLEIAQIASYNHPAVTHDTTLAGSGQIGDPLGVTPAVFGKVKDIPTSISQFRNGDVIPVDGPNGPAKMGKDDLLKKTAQKFPDIGNSADFVISDNQGYAISVFKDGHIKTKNFDSKYTFSNKDTENSDFVIADPNRNAIAVFKDGHIKTKNFDSAHIATEWTIDFTGKKFCFIGDSLTAESDGWVSYVSLLAARTGATCVNLGVGGDSIGGRAGAQYGHFKDRATAANLQGADLVCVFGGTNDFDRATYPIGPLFKEIQNTPWQYSTGVQYGVPDNTGAFGGAVHELILTIRQNCPATPIMFITPLNRGEYSDNRPTSKEQNVHGDTMQDFRNAIEVICNFYAIPVFKAHQNPQFDFTDAVTAARYSRDNLHPNLLGQTILERQLEKWIYLNINL